ncbi:uncharacterized protein THITE_2110848 [Thermothielavioides terrestris NRRL 8126]|uniref:Uncharacterized protein n=1 Tax=Thermothielavioides terrestris (strain ATCC 38088 / NRRL 8126) TaxID=578455 RepID=G2QUL4_THETT|nr:uncharacterized protein THITE_2110848 [Thermothielavioides terrestris NRRL 8126]AEO64569.1 hypothetical protein THITE_2110848 [Thermothielavioides terrestris NRRL 8126]
MTQTKQARSKRGQGVCSLCTAVTLEQHKNKSRSIDKHQVWLGFSPSTLAQLPIIAT